MKHQEFSPLPTRSHTIAVSAIQPVMTIHLLPNCFSQLSQMCWPTFTHSPHPWTKTFKTFLLLPPLWPTNHRSDRMGSENGALRGTFSLLFVLLTPIKAAQAEPRHFYFFFPETEIALRIRNSNGVSAEAGPRLKTLWGPGLGRHELGTCCDRRVH